ncbi:MAG: SixA phosphatase family protein [Pyrinomonadaceae bacterium]
MKIIVFLFCGLLFAFSGINLFAQDMTIILLRHAEKDVSPQANKYDPDLTAAGKERAERLVETIRKYKPEQIFSTNYKRARETVDPLAENLNEKYRIQVQSYDFDELEAFADTLLKSNARTIVVVGHNNTTPALANLLIKQNKYKDLQDSEYDKIFIIKIKNGKVKDTVIEY